MRDDAVPLVERDPTPPAGMAPVSRRPARQWGGVVLLAIVLGGVLAAVVTVTATSM